MRKYFLALFAITFSVLSAQNTQSLQVNFGLLYPRSSSNGFTTHFEYNFQVNSDLTLYAYTGYSKWDKYNVIFETEITEKQRQPFHKIYLADDHVLIPFFIGGKYFINRGKVLSSFVSLETGYSYLKFNEYGYTVKKDPDTGEILEYYTNLSSRKRTVKNIFGVGFGFGFVFPLLNQVDFIAQYKVNSSFNSGEYGLLSARGTYSSLLMGINLKL